MNVRLMHSDRDFDVAQRRPRHEPALRQDLELDTLLAAMAADDPFLLDVATAVLFSSLVDPHAIRYRQDVLGDCLEQPELVREMYGLAIVALEARRGAYFGYRGVRPETILRGCVRIVESLVGVLKRLKRFADEHAERFRSEGFRRLFAMLDANLDDAYFAAVDEHLERLRLRDGVLISARLAAGNKATDHTLRTPNADTRSWLQRITAHKATDEFTFEIHPRDQAGATALAELRARGINAVADALAQSMDHIFGFFEQLRAELGFYVGCLNLRDRLAATGQPCCFPTPVAAGEAALSAKGLYDACLVLSTGQPAVGNDLAADGKRLVMITGANQGGKSTFLRAIGIAQLMMQCGMFVGAEGFTAGVRTGVFTHYRREEDETMRSGKLDEELARMSAIADDIRPGGLLLCNESFASTNEREGSEIARQIVRALLDRSVRVTYVTHLFDLAGGFHREARDDALFLRAERTADGRRTFKLREGEPLPTSHGRDLYEATFGAEHLV